MSEAKDPTETIIATKSSQVIVNGEPYTITKFKLAKAMLAFKYIAELSTAVGVDKSAEQIQEALMNASLNGEIPTNLLGKVFEVLPKIVINGPPSLYRLLGLVITPNPRLQEFVKEDKDLDKELYDRGYAFAFDADVQETVSILVAGTQQLGVETIVKKVNRLIGSLSANDS